MGTVGTREKFIVIYNIELQTASPIGITVNKCKYLKAKIICLLNSPAGCVQRVTYCEKVM